MYSSRTSASSRRYGGPGVPPSSRRSTASGEPPLTAERAMMDQIRSKLERAQRRLARQPGMSGSHGSSSSVSSRYIPSSEYGSMMNRPPIQSVRLEDMPATTSSNYNSTASYGLPPSSTARRHAPPSRQGVPPPSSRHPDSRHRDSRHPDSSSKYAKQYQSRSKYSHSGNSQDDPLNGGPPPMSTPYLVYSSSRPPMSTAKRDHYSIKSGRPPPSSRAPAHQRYESEAERDHRLRREDEEARRRPPRELDPSRSQKPPMSSSPMLNGPPSAMRSGLPRPPSSRVRFEGHEPGESSEPKAKEKTDKEKVEKEKGGKESEKEKKRRQHEKEVEIAHRRMHTQRLRQENKEHESNNILGNPGAPSSPIAAGTRQRRSRSIEHPPNSAIKTSAFEATPSPMGRPRRSSISMPPPKSDIKVSAFDDVVPPRRGSGSEESAAPTPAVPDEDSKDAKPEEEEEAAVVEAAVVVVQPHSGETDEEEPSEPVSPSPAPGTEEFHKKYEQDDDTSEAGSDESDVHDFSDFDVDSDLEELSSFVSYYGPPSSVAEVEIVGNDYVAEAPVPEDNNEDDPPSNDTVDEIDATEPAAEADEPPPLPAEKEEEVEDEPRPSQRMTTKDLAFLALGRSSMSFSDTGSPITSAKGDGSYQRPPAAPMSMAYTPASTAFPPGSRARPPIPATMGRPSVSRSRGPRAVPQAPQTAGYVRRSRPRAPLDLSNELPPSIGILSGLSSGPATFTMDPSCFYEVTWMTGEFAFSLQRVYTDENEFEFDDSNQEPQLFLRMLLNTDRSTCESFKSVRVGDVLIRVGDTNLSELGLEGSGSVLTKFFAKLRTQLPIRLTFQRMFQSEWEGGVEL